MISRPTAIKIVEVLRVWAIQNRVRPSEMVSLLNQLWKVGGREPFNETVGSVFDEIKKVDAFTDEEEQ